MLNKHFELTNFKSWVSKTHIPGAEVGHREIEFRGHLVNYLETIEYYNRQFVENENSEKSIGFLKDAYELYDAFMKCVAEEYFDLQTREPFGFLCLYFMDIVLPIHGELILTRDPKIKTELSYIHMYEFWTQFTQDFIEQNNPWSAQKIRDCLKAGTAEKFIGDTKWQPMRLDLSQKSKTASLELVAL